MSHLFIFILLFISVTVSTQVKAKNTMSVLKKGFVNPPDSARPGVYWYFMDGNLSREGMTKDLESMKQAGIGQVLFLEVNVGVPRGKVDFMSNDWMDLFAHAVKECERLGITMTLGIGPGWSGSGGPWVTGKQSMQHLVSSQVKVSKGQKIVLPVPEPKKPYFGENVFTPDLKEKWLGFYEDVIVLAFPTPTREAAIPEIDDKALYYRAPFTSVKGVKPWFSEPVNFPEPSSDAVIDSKKMVDVTKYLQKDGSLVWEIPEGNWTIMRFGVRNNGAVTRPAPMPGLGFECDKMDTAAFRFHLEQFTGKLLKKTGIPDRKKNGGLKMLHMDSWEMGSQNWSPKFRDEFLKRRGYDLLYWLPVYSGFIVENRQKSERFLWDLRQVSQELVVENHAKYIKTYAHKNNMGLSIEPYDMNPTADMALGSVADVAMCEFWSEGYGFNSSFSCIQASSIAHVNGFKVVAAESFTAHRDAWKLFPGSMKNQGDWAFAAGINRFVYHTFQHQLPNDDLKPGITMGPYGVHWDRSQTWWPMANSYHNYISRCQFLLQQGVAVADILYLTPEGAPHVFKAPATALEGSDFLPDKKGFGFDGCAPDQLYLAEVKDNRIVFPGGASYQMLVLPNQLSVTPKLLTKVEYLIKNGAFVAGNPRIQSPSLVDYPNCDAEIRSKSESIWGSTQIPQKIQTKNYGKGKIVWGSPLLVSDSLSLFPDYEITEHLLKQNGFTEDFLSNGSIRYTHRVLDDIHFYFVSNRTSGKVKAACRFRVSGAKPELWDPLTGKSKPLAQFNDNGSITEIPLEFDAAQSFFVVFNPSKNKSGTNLSDKNFPKKEVFTELNGSWQVLFDPKWGGPAIITMDSLKDWTTFKDDGIRHYSGIATYKTNFKIQIEPKELKSRDFYLNLGEVNQMARVRINGKEVGIIWCVPFNLNVSGFIKKGDNKLEIEVANLWANRLIGDESKPFDGVKDKQWPDWLIGNKPRNSGRYTFTTGKFYNADSPLIKSGLIGPVRILIE